jgi:hypothetical protein
LGVTWQLSWIWFPSIIWRTPASTGPIFWWLIGGVINLHHVPLLPKPYLPCTHRQLPTRGAHATPCIALVNLCRYICHHVRKDPILFWRTKWKD